MSLKGIISQMFELRPPKMYHTYNKHKHSFWSFVKTVELLHLDNHWLLIARCLFSFLHPLLLDALHIPATAQYKPAIPSNTIIVMQQLSVQSYSPLTSLNQSPLTKPYKNLCPRREQTAEYQSVPGAAFKKAGLCLNRAALFQRRPRGIIEWMPDKVSQSLASDRPLVVLAWRSRTRSVNSASHWLRITCGLSKLTFKM